MKIFEIEIFDFFDLNNFQHFRKVSLTFVFSKKTMIFFNRSRLNFDAHPFPLKLQAFEFTFFTVLAALIKVTIFFHHVHRAPELSRAWWCNSHVINFRKCPGWYEISTVFYRKALHRRRMEILADPSSFFTKNIKPPQRNFRFQKQNSGIGFISSGNVLLAGTNLSEHFFVFGNVEISKKLFFSAKA